MIRSFLTTKQSTIQQIFSHSSINSTKACRNIFQVGVVSQTRHLTTKKKKITAEKLEKLEKNLQEREYIEAPEEINKPTKLLTKLTAIHREKWHLKQKPKVSVHSVTESY